VKALVNIGIAVFIGHGKISKKVFLSIPYFGEAVKIQDLPQNLSHFGGHAEKGVAPGTAILGHWGEETSIESGIRVNPGSGKEHHE